MTGSAAASGGAYGSQGDDPRSIGAGVAIHNAGDLRLSFSRVATHLAVVLGALLGDAVVLGSGSVILLTR